MKRIGCLTAVAAGLVVSACAAPPGEHWKPLFIRHQEELRRQAEARRQGATPTTTTPVAAPARTTREAKQKALAAIPPARPAASSPTRTSTRRSTARRPAAVPAAAPVTIAAPPPAPPPPQPPAELAAMQFLYGSGEGAALTQQSWRMLVHHTADAVLHRPKSSVVLTAAATLANPIFEPCGEKPLAVVLDVDETLLLNLGFEADELAHPGRPYDHARWEAFEQTGGDTVIPTPGAGEAISWLHTLGVKVVFNTNRSAANAAQTEVVIEKAGLGPAKHGDTLFFEGDDASGPRKDGRRAAIATRYCVVAMAGDQLGDFSDLFNADASPAARRATTTSGAVARLWGDGWFVMPNPVYGTALKGGPTDIFPADRRWTAPAR